MKDLKYKELVAYAGSFVSFILPNVEVDEIILFGSATRDEATKESDIDLFFNIKTKEKSVKKIVERGLKKFYKSKVCETWSLKGIKNPIKIQVGDLNKWKLKRSIISDGIVLYGKYKESPEKTKGAVYFNIKPIKNIAKRNRIIRKLFGRTENNYSSRGFVKNFDGKKLSATSFIVPIQKSHEVIKFLNSEKIDFIFFEFWSDQLI